MKIYEDGFGREDSLKGEDVNVRNNARVPIFFDEDKEKDFQTVTDESWLPGGEEKSKWEGRLKD